MHKINFIGISYLKKWINNKANEYEKISLNSLNMDELQYIKGKLDILNELLNELNVYENQIIKRLKYE